MPPTLRMRAARTRWKPGIAFLATLVECCLCAAAVAQPGMSSPVPRLEFHQRLGARVPTDATFTDQTGTQMSLEALFRGRPVVLVPVYYGCPMLCTQVLNGVVRAMKGLSLRPGEDFTLITYSIDPRETPDLAARKRDSYLAEAALSEDAGWPFLVGSEQAVAELSQAIGFDYRRDPVSGLYAHPAGIVILTPDGVISRYLFGVEYAPRDLKLAILEASDGRIGSPADHLLLLCFQYDPARGKYGFMVMRAVRIGGVGTVLAIAGLVFFMSRQPRRRRSRRRGGAG